MTKRLILGVFLAVVVVAALGGAAFGAYTALNGAEAEDQQVRWANVTVTIPPNSDIHYGRLTSAPQAAAQGITGPVLLLTTGGDRSLVIIDAETGEVVHDDVLAAERGAFDAVLATVDVAEAEVAAEAAAPWPYGTALPSTPRRMEGRISYLEPDPASGIVAGPIYRYSQDGPSVVLRFYNTRSVRFVDAETGEFIEDLAMHPDDREAFDRLLAEIRVVSR